MKICKIKPTVNDCCCCIDDHADKNMTADCRTCLSKQPEHEILDIFTTLFGKSYALVIVDGFIEKLPIDRLYDVKKVQPVMGGNGKKYYGY